MPRNLLKPNVAGRRLLPAATSGVAIQQAFEDVGVPLHEVTFVVVDLETTGGSPKSSQITEIGAVKVRGGEVLGEFQTLVNPGVAVPPMITVLTGITTAMVMQAPPITEVLPSFLEFAHDSVLVAHNAHFDVGFLRAAASGMDISWPGNQVVDTVKLSRRVVTRDEVPNHKLGTLAGLFGAETTPNHRALSDARATVDVLHGLLSRMASLGVTHLEDLPSAADPVPSTRRRKAHLADGVPTDPGVYMFRGAAGRILYIGKASQLRRRVRSYFTAAEKRSRIGEMVDLTESVDVVLCGTDLEAAVRELRMIAQHKPPYNRRSRAPEKQPWLRLTNEAHPRLSIVRQVPVGVPAIGPFSSKVQAQQAMEAIHQAIGLRTCTTKLPTTPGPKASACVLAELGRCSAPCVDPRAVYEPLVAAARDVLDGHVDPVVAAIHRSIGALSASQRYEEAAAHRDRLSAFLRAAARTERLGPIAGSPQIVAARRPVSSPGARSDRWEIVVIRYGRLAATATTKPGHDPQPLIDALIDGAESVPDPTALGEAASSEETALIADWLGAPGVRLIEFIGRNEGWSMPVRGASAYLRDLGAAAFADPRLTEQHALGTGIQDPASRNVVQVSIEPRPATEAGAQASAGLGHRNA